MTHDVREMPDREERVEQALRLVSERSAEIAPGVRTPYDPSEIEKILADEVTRLRGLTGRS